MASIGDKLKMDKSYQVILCYENNKNLKKYMRFKHVQSRKFRCGDCFQEKFMNNGIATNAVVNGN